jgi:hypothetical protein
MATSEARIITDPEEVKGLDWEVPGAEYNPEDFDSSFEITKAFERQNGVILDQDALKFFKSQIETYYSPK